MKRVLLTGATGFIGRPCVAALRARGYEVHAVSSRPQILDADVCHHVADLLDPRQVRDVLDAARPTHLLHLAWYAVPGRYASAPENLRWVQASLGLLQEFAARGGRRVVTAGTCAEYDGERGFCSEGMTPLRPVSLYGTCKHALEIMQNAWAAQTGTSAAWGRIFFLYGPHEHPSRLVASVITSLLRGEPARCSPGEQIRDFLHVADVADAFAALLDADSVTGAVNIGSGVPVAVKEIVARIADRLGRRELVEMGARPAPPGEPPLLLADIRRLRDEVGWAPRHDLDGGLEQTIGWWKEAR